MVNNKKSRQNNKKTKKAPPPSSTSLVSTNGGRSPDHQALKSLTLECYHGSTAKITGGDSDYSRAITKYLSFCRTGMKLLARGEQPVATKFGKVYPKLLTDPDFSKFIFAFCTNLCLSNSFAVGKHEQGLVGALLTLGLHIRHVCIPLSEGTDLNQDSDNKKKAIRNCYDSQTERGMIKCLSRETKEFCDCMVIQTKKSKDDGKS